MSKRRSLTVDEKTALSHGFDAGNSDNAYASDDFDKARRGRKPRSHPGPWWCGYILGFFSSYETSEVPRKQRGRLIAAYRKCGEAARAQGIAVDVRP